jgi:dephospho-CoA kinase
MKNRIIGVSGQIGAGKTETSCILTNQWGYIRLSFGELVEGIIKEEKIAVTRKNLQDKGEELIRTIGCEGITDLLIKKTKIDEVSNYVVDGIRRVGVHLYFRKLFGDSFTLIYVDAPEAVRLTRIKYAGTPKNITIVTLDDLRAADEAPVEKGVPELKKHADVIIQNTGSREDLLNELSRYLFCK